MKRTFSKFTGKQRKSFAIAALILAAGIVVYLIFFRSITINPLTERKQMLLLEKAKSYYPLNDFVSDGCSGNVSAAWSMAVKNLSRVFPEIEAHYQDATTIPFEYACVAHDRLYHNGEGGYVGRLKADNQLRADILDYGMTNTADIKARTGLETDESAIFLYEAIAEIVYRGVRIGGSPCTGESYAWGYGYNDGVCEEINSSTQ